MIPRPPRSTRTVTPFPYTELVRSWRDATARCRGAFAVDHGLADVTCSRLAEASVGCLLFLNGRHLTGVAVKREVEGTLVADLHAVEQFGFRLECHCHRGPVGFRNGALVKPARPRGLVARRHRPGPFVPLPRACPGQPP